MKSILNMHGKLFAFTTLTLFSGSINATSTSNNLPDSGTKGAVTQSCSVDQLIEKVREMKKMLEIDSQNLGQIDLGSANGKMQDSINQYSANLATIMHNDLHVIASEVEKQQFINALIKGDDLKPWADKLEAVKKENESIAIAILDCFLNVITGVEATLDDDKKIRLALFREYFTKSKPLIDELISRHENRNLNKLPVSETNKHLFFPDFVKYHLENIIADLKNIAKDDATLSNNIKSKFENRESNANKRRMILFVVVVVLFITACVLLYLIFNARSLKGTPALEEHDEVVESRENLEKE
ncbi:hypothetical protein GINT2_002258 [Glugoides intestinalis]